MANSKYTRVVVVSLTVLFLALSQQQPIAISIETIPAFGTLGDLSGRAAGVQFDSVKVLTYIFLPDLGWYQRPGCGSAARLDSLGNWSSDITTGPIDERATKVAAYLVPVGFQPDCVQAAESVPFPVERIAQAKEVYERPDPAPPTIQFGGLDWVVKSSRIPVYPGPKTPNFFLDDSRNVFVDPQGRLHLRITRCGDAWCSSEVYTRDRVGYGSYRIQVDSPLSSFDPNLVLGMFTWSEDAAFAHRELDIEFSRWGQASDRNSAQFVVQPYDLPGNLLRFPINTPEPTSHTIQWSRGSVSMLSQVRSSGLTISQWNFPNPSLVPPPGDLRFHLNFYLNNAIPPADRQEKEIVLSAFSYAPTGHSVSLNESSVPVSSGSASINATVGSTDSSCAWTLRATVPWLKAVNQSGSGSRPVSLAVSSNPGAARSGYLQLLSDNCNVTLGRQQLLVRQEAFQCTLSLAADPMVLHASPRQIQIYVGANNVNCPWSASVPAPWAILRSPSTMNGSGYLAIDILENRSGEARETAVQIGPHSLRIFQDAQSAALSAVPNPVPLCEEEVSGSTGFTWDARGYEFTELVAQSPGNSALGTFPAQGSTIQANVRRPYEMFYLYGKRASGQRTWIASTFVPVTTCSVGTSARLGLGGLGNSASFQFGPLAPGQLGTVYGFNLARFTQAAERLPLPTELGGAQVSFNSQPAQLIYASPAQINFLVPDSIATGTHKISVGTSSGDVIILPASPGLFTTQTREGDSPLGSLVHVSGSGEQSARPLVNCAGGSQCSAQPITFAPDTKEVILVLYGTGMRAAHSAHSCTVANTPLDILYLGAQGEFPGLDQINVRIPDTLRGIGSAQLEVTVDGRKSNAVRLSFP